MWFDDEDRDSSLSKLMWVGIVVFLLFGLIAYMDAREQGTITLPPHIPAKSLGDLRVYKRDDGQFTVVDGADWGESNVSAADFWAAIEIVVLQQETQQEPTWQEPDHPKDQPGAHCFNGRETPKAHKCECKKVAGEDGKGCDVEDRSCREFCHRDHCTCFHPECDS